MTTAYLAMKIIEPDFEPVVMPFDKITDAVREHAVDAGLVIHEAQLTFGKGGFHNVLDLGAGGKRPIICRFLSALTRCSDRSVPKSRANAAV